MRRSLQLLLFLLPMTLAFHVPKPVHHHRKQLTRRDAVPPTMNIFGRFRKKRKVDQTSQIEPGEKVKDMDVEQLIVQEDGSIEEATVSVTEVLGTNKAVLVGMPGAFTPVCTGKHLPGYIKSADKLAELGIDKVVILTTNDRYVNEEWMNSVGGVKPDSRVSMISDGDGDLVKQLGLAEDMGFGVGVRSKRFAMVTDNGVCSLLLTDEGMDDCSATSAENLIEVLTPEVESTGGDMDVSVAGAGVVAVALLIAAAQMIPGGGGSSGSAPSPPPKASTTRTEKAKKAPQNESSFSLINQYLKSD